MLQRVRIIQSVALAAALLAGGLSHGQDVCTGVVPVNHTGLQRVLVGSGMSRPVLVLAAPGDTSRIFMVEQTGTIRVLAAGAGPTEHTLFMSIADRVSNLGNEMGLLGMAFDPSFATTGRFYLSYNTFVGSVIRSTVGRFNLDTDNPAIGDPDSEHEIITFRQPGQSNHNGGHIEIGSDGFLYMSVGDGGGSGDSHGTCGNGQNDSNVLGTLLRIDPLASTEVGPECAESGNYSIPAANPLADGPGGTCDEIWAYGLRNPWRFTFDRATDDLYIADVGQNCWEEINYVTGASTGGENYGWRSMEGLHCFNPATPFSCNPTAESCASSVTCGDPSLVTPIVEYSHNFGCSISGGPVYRGCRMPDLSGTYFYGDYCSGFVRSFRVVGGAATEAAEHTALDINFGLAGFGVDARGELFLVNNSSGQIFKVLPLLSDIQASGTGAADQFLLDDEAPWTWEDVVATTSQPVDEYRVYRGDPGASDLACLFASPSPAWPGGGDSSVPASGQMFSYLVTAANGQEESSGGHPDFTLTPGCP
jgi:glucose/arabinose dehydrogenase